MRSQQFYVGSNALLLYDVLQEDGATGLLNGLEKDAGVTASVAGAVQTVETDTQGEGVVSKPLLYPFIGATLVASATFSNANVRFRIGVRFLDAAKELISESYSDFVASSRRHHSAAVPAGTVYVQWISTRDAATDTLGSWELTQPALTINNTLFVY